MSLRTIFVTNLFNLFKEVKGVDETDLLISERKTIPVEMNYNYNIFKSLIIMNTLFWPTYCFTSISVSLIFFSLLSLPLFLGATLGFHECVRGCSVTKYGLLRAFLDVND